MAELAALGLAANIFQVISFSADVLGRLREYQAQLGDLPEAFRHINAELPVLLDGLKKTKAAIDHGAGGTTETRHALLPAIQGCRDQIRILSDLMNKFLPSQNDSRARRTRKAVDSLRYDEKVQKITNAIRGYVQTLTYHASVSSPNRPIPPTTPSPVHRPCSNVPFRRDPHFIERRVLKDLQRKMRVPGTRAATFGLGGVGKSQIAIEYSYRTREESPSTLVFWTLSFLAQKCSLPTFFTNAPYRLLYLLILPHPNIQGCTSYKDYSRPVAWSTLELW